MGEPGIDMEFAAKNFQDQYQDKGLSQQFHVRDTGNQIEQRVGKQAEAIFQRFLEVLNRVKSFNQLKRQLIPLSAELNSPEISLGSAKFTLLRMKAELQRKYEDEKVNDTGLKNWLPELISAVDVSIAALEKKQDAEVRGKKSLAAKLASQGKRSA